MFCRNSEETERGQDGEHQPTWHREKIMPTVTVVIPHYYEVRKDYIGQIANALNNGTVPPLEILVWNDGLTPFSNLPPNVHVLTPHRPIGSKSRYLAGLCALGDYILFHDNDMMVEPRTVEGFLKWVDYTNHDLQSQGYMGRDAIFSLEGRQVLNEFHGPMSDKNRLNGRTVAVPTAVDIPHSEISLSHRCLANRLVGDLPFTDPLFEMDDVMYAAAAKHRGIPRYVIPFEPGAGFIRLSEKGVGMWRNPGFYEERDRLVREHWPENFPGNQTKCQA
jgi:hypothetical protein